MSTLEKLKKILDDANVKYDLIKLPEDIGQNVSEHMVFHGDDMSKANINLVYKTDNGFIVLQKRGDTKIDNKKLRKILESKSIRFASKEEMDELGLVPGIVPIAGYNLDIYVDEKVLEQNVMYSTAADRIHGLKFYTKDLIKLNPNMKVVDATKEAENKSIKRVLSGITPSGNLLHIGNYFGAVKPHIELQDELDETFYFIADLHALTTVKNKEVLEKNITNVVLDYLALGLDPKKAIFFRQSDVPSHSELTVILGNYVSYGQMQRMHAFKDKLEKGSEIGSINMGLFNYPILMAADILVYKPDGVPVGEDQRQHVELTRDIAENFNRTYEKEFFPLPVPMIAKNTTAKVVGTDGDRKMSKSLGNIIGIFEEEEVIKKQIMGSYTDPNRLKATDPGKVEGNPVFIYHELLNRNEDEVNELKERYKAGTVGDVEVKQKLITAHADMFGEARKRRIKLERDMDYIKDILAEGARKAAVETNKTIEEVHKLIGLSI